MKISGNRNLSTLRLKIGYPSALFPSPHQMGDKCYVPGHLLGTAAIPYGRVVPISVKAILEDFSPVLLADSTRYVPQSVQQYLSSVILRPNGQVQFGNTFLLSRVRMLAHSKLLAPASTQHSSSLEKSTAKELGSFKSDP